MSGEIVHGYSRAQAIADGVLVDVTRQASPAEMLGGFAIPVAVTAAVWAAIEAIPDSLAGIADARGRLHDVLWMTSLACRRQVQRAKFSQYLANLASSGVADSGKAENGIQSANASKAPRCQVPGPGENVASSWPLLFAVHLPYRGTRKRKQRLAVAIGPDDDGSPCVTIGFPEDF